MQECRGYIYHQRTSDSRACLAPDALLLPRTISSPQLTPVSIYGPDQFLAAQVGWSYPSYSESTVGQVTGHIATSKMTLDAVAIDGDIRQQR